MKNNQSNLTDKQIQRLKNDIRQKYRNGTLEQELIDVLEADPDWKWEPYKCWSAEEFKKEVEQKNLDIELLENYKTKETRLLIRCRTCGKQWYETPHKLLHEVGCDKCTGTKPSKTKEFKEKLRRTHPYLELLDTYKNKKTKVTVRCRCCMHIWQSLPDTIINGLGCKKCHGYIKQAKKEIHHKGDYCTPAGLCNRCGWYKKGSFEHPENICKWTTIATCVECDNFQSKGYCNNAAGKKKLTNQSPDSPICCYFRKDGVHGLNQIIGKFQQELKKQQIKEAGTTEK